MNDQPADETQPIPSPESKRSARVPIIVGVGLLVAAVLGVGTYAGVRLAGGGPQPAEALPDSVVAYASIDIDPGASQKIEAIRTLRKFPDLKKSMDVKEDDDLRKRLFEEAIKDTDCQGKVTYADDIEPWLGDRAAVGAADLGADEPSPVFAIQVSDEGAAEKALKQLRSCDESVAEGSGDFSYGFNEGFLVISDGKDNADRLIKDAAKGTLADDDGFTDWSEQAGGDGIVTFYVSKKAIDLMADLVPPEVSTQGDFSKALEDFTGMAGALRFADGGLELEMAAGGADSVVGKRELGDSLTGLPDDTAVAVGFGVPDDFASAMFDRVEGAFGAQADQLLAEAEAQSGLSLPEDLQTLLGEAVLFALGGDAPDNVAQTQGPTDLPFGLKIIGDADKIRAVVDKAEERAGQKLSDADIVEDSDGDAYVLATNETFASALKKEGDLEGNENFETVVPEGGDSSFAVFVDFDSAWRESIIAAIKDSDAKSAEQADANTEPLGALGISGWFDDDVSHVLVKLTTD